MTIKRFTPLNCEPPRYPSAITRDGVKVIQFANTDGVDLFDPKGYLPRLRVLGIYRWLTAFRANRKFKVTAAHLQIELDGTLLESDEGKALPTA